MPQRVQDRVLNWLREGLWQDIVEEKRGVLRSMHQACGARRAPWHPPAAQAPASSERHQAASAVPTIGQPPGCLRPNSAWQLVTPAAPPPLPCQQVLESCSALLETTQIPVDGIVRLLQHILRPHQQELQQWAAHLLQVGRPPARAGADPSQRRRQLPRQLPGMPSTAWHRPLWAPLAASSTQPASPASWQVG